MKGFAYSKWPRGSVIGCRIRVVFHGTGDWKRIVGVVNASIGGPLTDGTKPLLYMPSHGRGTVAMVRARGEGNPIPAIRELIRRIDPAIRLARIDAMENVIARSIDAPRFVMLLLSLFTVLAVILAMIGLYGVMSYMVAQRTREIGIRVALGAPAGRVARAIIVRGVGLAAVGGVLGLLLSRWGGKPDRASALWCRTLRPSVVRPGRLGADAHRAACLHHPHPPRARHRSDRPSAPIDARGQMIRQGIRRVLHLALRRRDRWEREVEDEIKLHLRAARRAVSAQGASAPTRPIAKRCGSSDPSLNHERALLVGSETNGADEWNTRNSRRGCGRISLFALRNRATEGVDRGHAPSLLRSDRRDDGGVQRRELVDAAPGVVPQLRIASRTSTCSRARATTPG